MSSINGMHEDCALRLALNQSFTVVHPGVVTAKLSPSNQQQLAVRMMRCDVKKPFFHPRDVFDEDFRRQRDEFVFSTQASRQAGSHWTEIDSMHRLFQLPQSQTFRERIHAHAVWSKTQSQRQHSLGSEEMLYKLVLHAIAQTVALHARLQFEHDLPIVSRAGRGFK